MTKLEAAEIVACFYIGKRRMPSKSDYARLGLSDFLWHWDACLAGGMRIDCVRHLPLSQIVTLVRAEQAL